MISTGVIGDVSLVKLTVGRNDPIGAAEYPPPPRLSEQNLDWNTWLGDTPKKSFDPITFDSLGRVAQLCVSWGRLFRQDTRLCTDTRYPPAASAGCDYAE